MNNITQMLAEKLGYVNDDGEIEQDGPKGVKSLGPTNFRTWTNGQIRRAHARRAATQRRKTTSTYRRSWMNNQLNIANLRGQLQVVGAIPFADPNYVVSQDHPLHKASVETLTAKYGSVQAALARYIEILDEQANA